MEHSDIQYQTKISPVVLFYTFAVFQGIAGLLFWKWGEIMAVNSYIDNVKKVNITLERDGKTKIRIFYDEDGEINNHYDIDLFPKNRDEQVPIETLGDIKIS